MMLELETRRRSILPLLAGVLVAAYVFVFLPLSRKAAGLDAPLEQSWRKLATAVGLTNASRLDFVLLTNQFAVTRASLAAFEEARQQARARAALDDELRRMLAQPFQLVDYDTAAGRRMEELTRLAQTQKVTIETNVFAGFPEQRADMTEPALLWAELRFIDSLLTAAINAQVTVIHSITVPVQSLTVSLTNGPRSVVELPVQVELTGPVANVGRFLQTLPLRDAEIKAANLPASVTNKPALFIDRILLRKQSPEKLDEVRLTLRAVGFVFRE